MLNRTVQKSMTFPCRLTLLPALLAVVTMAAGCRSTSGSQVANDQTPASADCAAYQPVGDPAAWLQSKSKQEELAAIFRCASAPDKLPQGIGRGIGSVSAGGPVWNSLQATVGRHVWGGKRLYEANGGVELANLMNDSGAERYNARVILGTSIVDGKPTVILDYRIDDSVKTYGKPTTLVQHLVDRIVRGIRDEVRELRVNGAGTGVYIGRANLLTSYLGANPPPAGATEAEFNDPQAWQFAANFFLDFRATP